MGLERLAMVLQGKQSNYDTDLFQALIKPLEKISGFKYGNKEETDIALRVIADHLRAIAFSICDGQLPANTGAGYVIRRILRRAVRYGYSVLDLKESFMANLSKVLVKEMGTAFPELTKQANLIENVIREEENSFFRTLAQGLKRIEGSIAKTKAANKKAIDGAEVFELYDTFGFPVDLTSLIAAENNLLIDEDGFNNALNQQKERARAATAMSSEDWVILQEDDLSEFIGYDDLEATVKITKYRKVTQKKKTFYQLVI
jgi:alanyl-tRNA synthetase (EC 6.1.1.7)